MVTGTPGGTVIIADLGIVTIVGTGMVLEFVTITTIVAITTIEDWSDARAGGLH